MTRSAKRSYATATLWALAMAGTALAQDAGGATREVGEANDWFFGPWMFVILLAPIVITIVLAKRRAKSQPPKLPEWDDASFESEVVASQMPVLVHFALDWNITNRAALAQTEILQYANRGAVTVGLLHTDKNPATMERFPGMEPPAYLLFYRGKKLFHRPGFWQAEDLQQHIDRALSAVGF